MGFAHKDERHTLIDMNDLDVMKGAAGNDKVKVSDMY